MGKGKAVVVVVKKEKSLPTPSAHQSPRLHVILSTSTSSNTSSGATYINLTAW